MDFFTVTEADPEVHTVGIGSYHDRDGTITRDACIMNSQGDCGSAVAGYDPATGGGPGSILVATSGNSPLRAEGDHRR